MKDKSKQTNLHFDSTLETTPVYLQSESDPCTDSHRAQMRTGASGLKRGLLKRTELHKRPLTKRVFKYLKPFLHPSLNDFALTKQRAFLWNSPSWAKTCEKDPYDFPTKIFPLILTPVPDHYYQFLMLPVMKQTPSFPQNAHTFSASEDTDTIPDLKDHPLSPTSTDGFIHISHLKVTIKCPKADISGPSPQLCFSS